MRAGRGEERRGKGVYREAVTISDTQSPREEDPPEPGPGPGPGGVLSSAASCTSSPTAGQSGEESGTEGREQDPQAAPSQLWQEGRGGCGGGGGRRRPVAEAGQQKGGHGNKSSPEDLFLISRTSRAWMPWDCSWPRICKGRRRLGPAQHGRGVCVWGGGAGERGRREEISLIAHTPSPLALRAFPPKQGPEPQTHPRTQSQRSAPGLGESDEGRGGREQKSERAGRGEWGARAAWPEAGCSHRARRAGVRLCPLLTSRDPRNQEALGSERNLGQRQKGGVWRGAASRWSRVPGQWGCVLGVLKAAASTPLGLDSGFPSPGRQQEGD